MTGIGGRNRATWQAVVPLVVKEVLLVQEVVEVQDTLMVVYLLNHLFLVVILKTQW